MIFKLRYSSIGVQNIIFEFKIMIYELIQLKRLVGWVFFQFEMHISKLRLYQTALVQMQNNFAETFLIVLSNKIA